MEEAEALADRVLIMAHGEILCGGTTEELKIRYGSGYVLKLMCGNSLDGNQVMRLVLAFVPGASVKVHAIFV